MSTPAARSVMALLPPGAFSVQSTDEFMHVVKNLVIGNEHDLSIPN